MLLLLTLNTLIGSIHERDLSGIATKAGESYQNVTSKLASLKLGDGNGNVTFEDFLKARLNAFLFIYLCRQSLK